MSLIPLSEAPLLYCSAWPAYRTLFASDDAALERLSWKDHGMIEFMATEIAAHGGSAGEAASLDVQRFRLANHLIDQFKGRIKLGDLTLWTGAVSTPEEVSSALVAHLHFDFTANSATYDNHTLVALQIGCAQRASEFVDQIVTWLQAKKEDYEALKKEEVFARAEIHFAREISVRPFGKAYKQVFHFKPGRRRKPDQKNK